MFHIKKIIEKTSSFKLLYNKININKTIESKLLSNIKMSKISENKAHIVWVDLEMSGLDIDTEHILEMAILM